MSQNDKNENVTLEVQDGIIGNDTPGLGEE